MDSTTDPLSDLPDRLAAPWSMDRPVWQQLGERLEGWIRERCPTGYRFPNERKLAAMAGVNRLTLRKATARLLRDGLLERNARTTRVCAVTENNAAAEEFRPHPLMSGRTAGRRHLVIACFESLPWQANCWREAQPILAAAAGCAVEFKSVPVTVAAAPEYAQFLAAEQVDIAFLTSLMFEGLDDAGALATLPVQGLLAQPGLTAAAQTMPERACQRFVPIHIGWRCALIEEASLPGMPPAARRDPVAFAAWLASQSARLSPGAVLVDDPGYLFLLAGEPLGDAGDGYFRSLGQLGGAIAPALGRCSWHIDEPARGRSFAGGKAVAFVGNGFYGPGRFATSPSLRWRALPLAPLPGCGWRQAATGVAMTAGCQTPGAAAAVISAFLSPAVQDLVGRYRLNLPVREGSWGSYATGLGLGGAQDLAPAAASLRMSFEREPWSQFLEHTAGSMLRGGVDSARACEDALRAAASLAPGLAHSAA